MPFRRVQWRFILPIGNLVIATCLLVIGNYQHRDVPSKLNATGATHEWQPERIGPIAPAIQVAYAINFPALLIARVFGSTERTLFAELVFCCGVLVVWYIIGHIFDVGLPKLKRKPVATVVSIIGLLGSILGIWMVWRALGTHYFVPLFGAMIWLTALVISFAVLFKNAIRTSATTAGGPTSD